MFGEGSAGVLAEEGDGRSSSRRGRTLLQLKTVYRS